MIDEEIRRLIRDELRRLVHADAWRDEDARDGDDGLRDVAREVVARLRRRRGGRS